MIVDYLDGAFGEGTHHNTSKGLQISYKCPFCGDYKERMFVNVDTKVFFCHNCDAKGSLVTLISDYASISWKEALDVYRQFEGYEVVLPESIEDEVFTRLIQTPVIERPKYVHPLPEEFILIEDAKGKAGNEAIRYLRSRGITLNMAERNYIGYCEEGKYANRIIMPDFEDGELIYWQARTWKKPPKNKLLKKVYRKVLNPSLTEEQLEAGIRAVDKSSVIGNIDSILDNGIAVLVEGKMDQYTLLDSGACLHGKYLSDDQFLKLVLNKDKIDCIAVMMDGDAFQQSVNIADRLYKHFDDVLVCRLPDNEDPNNLGTKKCLEILNDALPYSPLFGVKAKMKGWI